MPPKISIIVPIIYPYSHIDTFLSIVHSSTTSDIEFLFVDGSSNHISNQYQLEIEKNGNKYIFSRSCSIYEAMNIGAKVASGSWYYFCGLDDTPNIKNLIKAANHVDSKNNINLLACFIGSPSSKGWFSRLCSVIIKLVNSDPKKILRYGMIISHQDMIINSEKFHDIGGFNRRFNFSADFDVFVKCALSGDILIERTIPSICERGVYGASSDRKNRIIILNEFREILLHNSIRESVFLRTLYFIYHILWLCKTKYDEK